MAVDTVHDERARERERVRDVYGGRTDAERAKRDTETTDHERRTTLLEREHAVSLLMACTCIKTASST
jgi:hypothetical protein